MLETRLLRRVIHYIWECYRERGEMRVRLKSYQGDELHVEEAADNLTVTVRYWTTQPRGEWVKQVEVICGVLRHGEWIPLQLSQGATHTVYGTIDAATGNAVVLDTQGQREAAVFCDAWAFRLLEEGFLATAAKHHPIRPRPAQRPNWPQPTVPTPSLEQIEEWYWEDTGCEATDGCWLEPDGVCPHGHPSWLLRLGLI